MIEARMALGSAPAAARMVSHAMSRTETTMTKRESNQQRSLVAFLAKKAAFDALLAELQRASADHFGADPEAVLWAEAAWLHDATTKLREIADQHFKRGEFAD
jgi:hypothetical protein